MGMKNKLTLVLVTITVLLSQSLWATDEQRRQAKRIHDRLTGVPATNSAIDDMDALLGTDSSGKSAAQPPGVIRSMQGHVQRTNVTAQRV